MYRLLDGITDCNIHTIDIHWFLFNESPTNISLLPLNFSHISVAFHLQTENNYLTIPILTYILSSTPIHFEQTEIQIPLQITAVGLPSPMLVTLLGPSMLLARQLIRHIRAVKLTVKWMRSVIKDPLAREEVTTLWHFSSTTRFWHGSIPIGSPATIFYRVVAFTKLIQFPSYKHLYITTKSSPLDQTKIHTLNEET